MINNFDEKGIEELRKRVLSVLLATATASILFTGCGNGTASTNNNNETNATATTNERAISNDTPETDDVSDASIKTKSTGKLDPKWLEGATKHYNKLVPKDIPEDEVFCIYEYSDDYRGEFDWCIYNNNFDMDYYTEDQDSFSISIDRNTGEIELSIEINYDDDTSFEVSYEPMTTDNITPAIANLSISTFGNLYEDSAFENHDVKGDVSIMYERFLHLSGIAFRKAGTGSLEKYGLILTELNDVEPATPLSKEVPYITSNHIFGGGVCRDCNKTWAECVQDAIGELEGDSSWRAKYGIHNEYANEGSHVCFYNITGNLDAVYNSIYIKPGRIGNIYDDFYMTFVDTDRINIKYEYEDIFETSEKNADGDTIVGLAKFSLSADVTPEELVEIISSKKKLEEVCEYQAINFSPDHDNFVSFDGYSDEEIEAYLNEHNYSMVPKADLCERLSENAKTYILGIDKSLIEVGATLNDCGIDIESLK